MWFEWDPRKAIVNAIKHGVTFDEAATAFRDPLAACLRDDEHSVGEKRRILVGLSAHGRLLLVSFAEKRHDCIRLINARPATRRERRNHEERFFDQQRGA